MVCHGFRPGWELRPGMIKKTPGLLRDSRQILSRVLSVVISVKSKIKNTRVRRQRKVMKHSLFRSRMMITWMTPPQSNTNTKIKA